MKGRMSSHPSDRDPPGGDEPADLDPTGRVSTVRDSLDKLLVEAVQRGASDLHITVGAPPSVRVAGEMLQIRSAPLSPRDTSRLCQQMLSEQQIERFAASHALRMSFGVPNVGRFRGSFFMQRGAMSGVYRYIPRAIPTLEALGLSTLLPLAGLRRGLVLVGGPLGSGKSTTIAGLLSAIARSRSGLVLTLEDPTEFLLPPMASSLVAQIEIGTDYPDFKTAFAAAMAQNPDVLMISELTGIDAIEGAVEATETGRLVIAASPSRSIAKAIARLVDAYPTETQARARARISDVLEAVTCQSIANGEADPSRRVTCDLVTADAGLRFRVRDGSALLE